MFSRVHGYTFESAFFAGVSWLVLLFDTFTFAIRLLSLYKLFKLFYSGHVTVDSLKRVLFKGQRIIEDPNVLLEATNDHILWKSKVSGLFSHLRVLSGITQFADAIPHVQFLQRLIDRLVDNQEPTEEDLKEFKRVQYYVKEKFGPIWKIIEPHSNHKSLIKTIFSHALTTGKLNDIDLDSLADQLRLIFNSNVTTPAIFESITPLVTTMEALFSVSTFETFLANNFSDFNKYFEEFREDPEFVNSFYSAYDEISSLMDEKHTDIIASRDAADNKTDKKRLNAVISAFQKLSSDVRKEYNKLDTIEKQKLANQNKEQRKQDNIEKQQKSKLVKDIKKRESAAAALAGIIKYANASGAELTARNIMQYIPEAKEETVHEPSYYRNIYAPLHPVAIIYLLAIRVIIILLLIAMPLFVPNTLSILKLVMNALINYLKACTLIANASVPSTLAFAHIIALLSIVLTV